MKFVDAFWEKENIGVKTVELTVENTDSETTVFQKLKDMSAEYIVLKVPTDYAAISSELSNLGFYFIETINYVSSNLHLPKLSEEKQRTVDETNFVEMSDDDFEYMCSRVIKDQIFRTDRIARDPHFSLDLANKRYVNWMKTEKARGAIFHKYVYQGQNIGFDCVRRLDGGVYSDLLTGLYPEFCGKGLSVVQVYKLTDYILQEGGIKKISGVSSSNVLSMRFHLKSGDIIDQSYYVYVKHNPSMGGSR